MEKDKLTFGERACGASFNPGGNPQVADIKHHYAVLVDALNSLREVDSDPEVKRMLSIAITEAQTSQMWAVKAVTWSL
jgi:hypothetical protein